MAIEEQQGNEKTPKKGKLLTGKYKWYVVGGLGLIAVLVFVFVRKSNANSTGGTTTGGATTSMDPATQAALQSALQAQSAAGYQYQAATGPQGVPGPVGPIGPTGAAGKAGTPGTPGKPGTTPKPAPKPAPKPSSTNHTYTVKSGDSLSKIASQFHIAGGWQALYNSNRSAVGSNPNLIHPGQRLKIP
jgi:LysM repeat protein